MRGEIKAAFLAVGTRDSSRLRPASRAELAHERSSSSTASSWRSLTITLWSNSFWAASSRSATAQAPLDLLRRVGAAADEPLAQRRVGRRHDEHLHRRGQRLAHLARALHLDLQHDRHAGAGAALELGAQRPVAAAGVGGVLDERAGGDLAIELGVAEEVVVDAVDLAGPRRARRRRDRQLELRHAREQAADQRALADARGPVMTKTRATRGSGRQLSPQQRDELGALPRREPADRLARRDAALREDLVRLHAAVLRHREQQVEDLRRLDVGRAAPSAARGSRRDRP